MQKKYAQAQDLPWFEGTEPPKVTKESPKSPITVSDKPKIEITNDQFIPAVKPKQKSNAISQMQAAMIDLSKTISAHDFASHTPSAYTTKSGNKELNGYKSFSNILINNYIGNNDPKKHPDIATFIAGIKNIGSGQAPTSPDGDWGEKTNNALINIFKFAIAINKFMQDLGIESNIYPIEKANASIAYLQENAPAKKTLNESERDKLAKTAIQTIASIKSLYLDFKSKVLDNKEMSEVLSQQSPLFKEQTLNKKDADFVSKNPETIIPSVDVMGKEIRLKDIKDYASFKKFLSTIANISKEAIDSNTFVDSALKKLSDQLSKVQGLGF